MSDEGESKYQRFKAKNIYIYGVFKNQQGQFGCRREGKEREVNRWES